MLYTYGNGIRTQTVRPCTFRLNRIHFRTWTRHYFDTWQNNLNHTCRLYSRKLYALCSRFVAYVAFNTSFPVVISLTGFARLGTNCTEASYASQTYISKRHCVPYLVRPAAIALLCLYHVSKNNYETRNNPQRHCRSVTEVVQFWQHKWKANNNYDSSLPYLEIGEVVQQGWWNCELCRRQLQYVGDTFATGKKRYCVVCARIPAWSISQLESTIP